MSFSPEISLSSLSLFLFSSLSHHSLFLHLLSPLFRPKHHPSPNINININITHQPPSLKLHQASHPSPSLKLHTASLTSLSFKACTGTGFWILEVGSMWIGKLGLDRWAGTGWWWVWIGWSVGLKRWIYWSVGGSVGLIIGSSDSSSGDDFFLNGFASVVLL